MSGKRNTSQDAASAGAFAAAGIANVARSMGESAPKVTGMLTEHMDRNNGFLIIKSFQSVLVSIFIFVASVVGFIVWWHSLGNKSAGLIALLFMICGIGLGIGLVVWFFSELPSYAAVKLRARCWPLEENLSERVNTGCSVSGNHAVDTVFVAPFYMIGLAFVVPFWIIGCVLEIVRSVFVPGAHYRGDQGKYYVKARKGFAREYSKHGVDAAVEWLRLAYSGMLTPPGVEIPKSEWRFGEYKNWLAPMIERHGPVDKYCKGAPGRPKGTVSKTIPSKYTAI